MKFLYSDSLDYVDPNYDFINDESSVNRKKYLDDQYAHEIMDSTPYDGLLVAISAIKTVPGAVASKTKYSTAEEQLFLRKGARSFLRFNSAQHLGKMVMGDCGSFAYANHKKPAFEPDEVVDFYSSAGFTHGTHPDHIIFNFDINDPSKNEIGEDVLFRYNITLSNAEKFLKITKKQKENFEPIGVVQGWSPKSMAQAAKKLEKMGYEYIAIGGLVPLKPEDIHLILRAIKNEIKPTTKIHLLGFAKADYIFDFIKYDITSFDSTAPLIMAFKDSKRNYFVSTTEKKLDYYTAIRIPQFENTKLMSAMKSGLLSPNLVRNQETKALNSLRGFDQGNVSLETTVENILDYLKSFLLASDSNPESRFKKELKITNQLIRTLKDSPWKNCSCSICRTIGVEVMIFRASNRNKRRGFHNLSIYHDHVQKMTKLSNQMDLSNANL